MKWLKSRLFKEKIIERIFNFLFIVAVILALIMENIFLFLISGVLFLLFFLISFFGSQLPKINKETRIIFTNIQYHSGSILSYYFWILCIGMIVFS